MCILAAGHAALALAPSALGAAEPRVRWAAGMSLVYKSNPKHKRGSFGEGPPRWFPDRDAECPEDLGTAEAQQLLEQSIEGADDSHPNRRARYVIDESGRIFKGYCESSDDGAEHWHGYPVDEQLIPRQVPSRVLREFVRAGHMTKARYKKLVGSAR